MHDLRKPPVVLVPACQRELGDHPFHVAGKKYIDAVRLAGCMPLVVPTVPVDDIPALLDLADGVLLTGSPSNVHPSHFGEDVHDTSLPLDPDRDAWTLPLIREALARGLPLLGICRGFQEVNVALGGSLYQAVHEHPGHLDHRSDDTLPADEEYAHTAHTVRLVPGGVLERTLSGLAAPILSAEGDFLVNSLHGQGVRQLAPGVQVQAQAPDGIVEAFTWVPPGQPQPSGFNLCLQWHPEWQAASNPVSLQIFQAFGAACRTWQAGKPSADKLLR